MFPKTGNRFPNPAGPLSEGDYAKLISKALRDELGTTSDASKTVQRWTGATDRSARNWLNGSSGPNGRYLIALARHSDAVLSTILNMVAKPELTLTVDVHAVEVALAKASGALEVLRRQRTERLVR